jgi:hypothetical protein
VCPECHGDCRQGRDCHYTRPKILGPWLKTWFEKEWLYRGKTGLVIVAIVLMLQICIWMGIY